MMDDQDKNVNSKNWDDDKLGRVNSANFLTKYLNNLYAESAEDIYLDSFVLNINAGWGFGKTFFLKHWMEDLKKLGHPVVYFDAWGNDYSENPLLAFMAELEDAFKEYELKVPNGERLVQGIFKSARKLIAPTLSIMANAITRKVLGDSLDNIKEAFTETGASDEKANLTAEKVENIVNNFVEDSIKDHRATKTAIKEFKNNMSNLVKALNEKNGINLPIYILIDELDRCRPTYAIELLEGIKHIFGVNGVFFIIATNKTELNHSISAVYGNGFDSSGYLRRFFDQEYILPKPDNDSFANYLIDKFRLGTDIRFFTPIEVTDNKESNAIAKTFALLANSSSISLRDQIQVARQLKAITLSINDKENIHMMYLIFLIMYKQKNEIDFDVFLEDEGIRSQINSVFNTSLTFDGYIAANNDFDLIPSKITLNEILVLYKSYSNKNATDLLSVDNMRGTSGSVFFKLKEEAPNSYFRDKFYKISISKYPELVRQAGHLLGS